MPGVATDLDNAWPGVGSSSGLEAGHCLEVAGLDDAPFVAQCRSSGLGVVV